MIVLSISINKIIIIGVAIWKNEGNYIDFLTNSHKKETNLYWTRRGKNNDSSNRIYNKYI